MEQINNIQFLGCYSKSQPKQPKISNPPQTYDDGFTRNVGWGVSIQDRPEYKSLFTQEHLLKMQYKITQLLEGVDKYKRPIIVPLETIASVMNEVVYNNSPIVGDIYSRYILPDIEASRNDFRDVVDRTIEIIVSNIKNEYLMIECNQKLTVWNSLLGDFNKQGIRAHSNIKIRNNGPARFQFNMNGPACDSFENF